MILSFQTANFRSLRDAALLSLEATADTEKPEGFEIRRQVPGLPAKHRGVLPCAVVYGPNAGGKSNVIKGLELLADLLLFPIRSHREVENDLPLANPAKRLQPFRLDADSRGAPVEFKICFLHKGLRYAYALSASRDRIYGESLNAWPAGRETLLYARGEYIPEGKSTLWKVFSRDDGMMKTAWENQAPQNSEEKDAEAWHFGISFGGGPKEAQALAGRTRPDVPFLSACTLWNHPQCNEVLSWFEQQLSVLDVETFSHLVIDSTARHCAMNRELKQQVAALLQAADLGIDGLSIESRAIKPPMGESLPSHKAWAMHTDRDGLELAFDIKNDESYGTQSLFGLAPLLVNSLSRGGTLVVDELHAGLHPLLIRAIVRLFQSPATNPKNAQLLFATHDVTLLDSSLLRRDQIYFAEKGADNATILYSLAEFMKKPRKDGALMTPYLEGRFHALPKLADDATWAAFARAFDKDAK